MSRLVSCPHTVRFQTVDALFKHFCLVRPPPDWVVSSGCVSLPLPCSTCQRLSPITCRCLPKSLRQTFVFPASSSSALSGAALVCQETKTSIQIASNVLSACNVNFLAIHHMLFRQWSSTPPWRWARAVPSLRPTTQADVPWPATRSANDLHIQTQLCSLQPVRNHFVGSPARGSSATSCPESRLKVQTFPVVHIDQEFLRLLHLFQRS